ncbi:MAG: divalent metal cation transporter [Clostridium sp.]|jgi:Mn2+/Fe2+ NRAMP family transporter|uniref:NRAMP family divalent metal transporter n=1 Tax=Clostridium sp. TaxID=1506 RepID=UPI0025BFA36F|nr:divalent metal cation transporter [Clostridium sp.]MCH3964664.1 divalent metal cation transporter [Clostridium sp.]MCI1715135.1 divalent metal cation transporter [Clostridium sp.]MCI1799397.1 divalent metal cation transporter [Clostridium sp.]MCI1813318.1 divalent metal cation transporter [Clostridium sp.]MCI1870209.1 divalent metal cation transporter [Clostridium sp.]
MSELQEDFNIVSDTKCNKNKLLILFSIIGPGFLAAMGDNDAGGLISYCITGAKFGTSFFIPLSICLAFITYTIQEMSMRLSVVTQKGFTALIGKYYGKFWMKYNVTAIFIENILMLTTEFIGMSAGLIVLGIPMWIGVVVSLALVLSVITFSGYWTKERLSLFIGFFNIVFVIIAFMTHPDTGKIIDTFVSWNYTKGNGNILWYIAAIVGNSVAPWMIFFQGSACIDKGIVKNNIKFGRIDTAAGCVIQAAVAICVIISGAALFGKVGNLDSMGPAAVITAFSSNIGSISGILFGIGLFNAGLLASITISLSTTWCVSEAFNWDHSLNSKISEAPRFYAVYIGSVILAAIISLIPNLPLNYMAVLTQVIGGFLMVPILVFLLMLTNKKELMGKYVNGVFVNIRANVVVMILVTVIVLLTLNFITGCF